uniref:mTERF domain-containing protein, mitochondrial n=2 Tax=Rhodosorus marinus TaxID=101924 RepID=A0A7S3ABF4_9RHOD|mmetsp:Transcript_8993/g.39674  ORF Transcript_8993/g.39674 Transcript_8993/m.39674 type:complete len:447 (+) Transcript_8993:239-1579(+)
MSGMCGFVNSAGFAGRRGSTSVTCNVAQRPLSMTLAEKETGQTTRMSKKQGQGQQGRRRYYSQARKEEDRRQRKHVERRRAVQTEPNSKLLDMLDYLREIGLSIEDCGRVVQKRPQVVDLDVRKDIEPCLHFLAGPVFGMNEKQIARTIRNAPQIFMKSRSSMLPRIDFLKRLGIEGPELANVASSRPHVLWMDLSNAKRVVDWVKIELEMDDKKNLARFFSAVPQVLLESPRRLEMTINWFKDNVGLSETQAKKAGEKWPYVFGYKPDSTFTSRIECLESYGLSKETIGRVVESTPKVVAMSVSAQLGKQMDVFIDLGIHEENLDKIISTVPTFFGTCPQARIEFFLSTGLDKGSLAEMIEAQPGILFLSLKANLRPKWEYFTKVMGGSAEDLKLIPGYFVLNLEQRIMPRFAFCCSRSVSAPIKDMVSTSEKQGIRSSRRSFSR